MKAKDIMITDVYKAHEGDSIRTVIEKFIDYNISGMPIVNDKDEIIAFISDGDIMNYIGKHKDVVVDIFFMVGYIQGDLNEYEDRIRDVLGLNVMALASRKVQKVQWNEKVENIATILGKKKIKKLPVERDGVLVGIISRGDVIKKSFKSLLS